MDPFSAEGELVNIHTAFLHSNYSSVLSDFSPDTFSASNHLPVQILQYRAHCALGQWDEVISAISDADAKKTPDLAAARVYASFLKKRSEDAVKEAERLAGAAPDNLHVQLLCGTVLARAGQPDAALALLAHHQGSLDAAALAVQIHLSQNRIDLATKEAKAARSFAQDALLVNLLESWIGMRKGGEEYQKAFYVFEEVAQAPGSGKEALVAQAVSEIHLGRFEEAEVALQQAEGKEEGVSGVAGVDRMVLETILGRDAGEARGKLESSEEGRMLIGDLQEKREAFKAAMEKYSPKFEP